MFRQEEPLTPEEEIIKAEHEIEYFKMQMGTSRLIIGVSVIVVGLSLFMTTDGAWAYVIPISAGLFTGFEVARIRRYRLQLCLSKTKLEQEQAKQVKKFMKGDGLA